MKRNLYALFSFLIGALLVVTACSKSNTPSTTTSTVVISTTTTATSTTITTPTSKPTTATSSPVQLSKPQYGNTLTVMGARYDFPSPDPRLNGGGNPFVLDRLIYRDQTKAIATATSLEGYRGGLVESWEIVSPTDFIYHVRQGVMFQISTLVNGREMTAYDIEYSIHRFLGLGSGFTQATPYAGELAEIPWQSVTATGKYTLEVKLKKFYLGAERSLLNTQVYPREIIDKVGDLRDWKQLAGTGPFILKDTVADSSTTYIKNPVYWDYDERNPGNKLPYLDTMKVITVPDEGTQVAALRAGKSTYMWVEDLQTSKNLNQSNPELFSYKYYQDAACLMFSCNSAPYNDVRVRQALQMAINLPEIAATFYEGTADPTPFGQLGDIKGYNLPYAEWPEDWKAGYAYNPDGAKALLTEAGYPNNLKVQVWDWGFESDLVRLVANYWENIGVETNTTVIDAQAFYGKLFNKELPGLTPMYSARFGLDPKGWMSWHFYDKAAYTWPNDDPAYNVLVEKMLNAVTLEEQRQLIQQADGFAVPKHWEIILPRRAAFFYSQPWFKGFDVEGAANIGTEGNLLAHCWIDRSVK